MGRLTTHVLDTARGSPASDLSIDLFRLDGDMPMLIKTTKTNSFYFHAVCIFQNFFNIIGIS